VKDLDDVGGVPVPWCQPYGRYWEKQALPSRSLDYTAGKYYIQEASAMLAIAAASQVIDFSDKIVLDLAAAPGGKATQAAELINSGYLVANEVIKKRLDALTWNTNRCRLNNIIITSLAPNILAQALPGFFDVVVVDAPCSGEGLFSKQKHSLEKWSEKNVRFCAARQGSILKDAVEMLKPGGFLVYSTCTFAPEENEHQVEFLLSRGFVPAPLPGDLPVSAAISDNEKVRLCSRRIFPHREGGAGAFVSVVQKQESPVQVGQLKYHHGQSDPVIRLKGMRYPHIRTEGASGYFYEKNGIISYFAHEHIPEFLLQSGYQIGAPVIDKIRAYDCMFGSVQLALPEAVIRVGEAEAEVYARGEELHLDVVDGYYYIAYNEMVLGPVKVANGRAVNKLPKPLRVRTLLKKGPDTP
jgi:16S rRNA C967 or C1407 C5-methylase (RsmB/RsmF family)